MLQVIIWLGCVYLVVKGVGVLMTALASPRKPRTGLIILGGLTLAACVAAAGLFFWLSLAIGSEMPELPRY